MNRERFNAARRAEADYHDRFYRTHELFAEGTWMAKPMPIVMEMLERLLTCHSRLNVLDLGCGVGRHAIAIAQRLKQTESRIIGVDLIDAAVDGLRTYAQAYGVDHLIRAEKADAEHYPIPREHFDYIVACSCLEHMSSKEALLETIERMQQGTRTGGIHYIAMSTNVKEEEIRTGRPLLPLIELNLSTEEAIELLWKSYDGWEILHQKTIEHKITEMKYDEESQFSSVFLRFAVQKK